MARKPESGALDQRRSRRQMSEYPLSKQLDCLAPKGRGTAFFRSPIASQGKEEWGLVGTTTLKIISWNLLRLKGARSKDVAVLIERHRPELLLLQEATDELAELPTLIGGYFYRQPMDNRVYGLGAWSPEALPPPYALPLPVSQVPGRVPPRIAQIVQFGEVTFANVHLSHGQFLNRWQLLHIANALEGPAAIVGDYNAVGPIKLPGFVDIGPRQSTHSPTNVISFRLDRCMGRGLYCSQARVLARGRSDHHPIALQLHLLKAARGSDDEDFYQAQRRLARSGFERWLYNMTEARKRTRMRQVLRNAIVIKLKKERPAGVIASKLSGSAAGGCVRV